ncbi:ribonuclease T2 [Rhodobacteraceae bacterium NNCM2]|nr:ribonuclease T2 [Coraliihabitans acroporae]
MRQLCIALVALAAGMSATVSAPAADRAGDFAYYVLALSWNAAWCKSEGDARDADQCERRHDFGWTLHGLWPQDEHGWPEYCTTSARNPSKRMSAEMADIMGSPGLAWYQWKKHGRCSGLSASDYYALSREAYRRINRPALLRKVDRTMALRPAIIEDAFIEANPGLKPSQLSVQCRDGLITEVRICLTRSLELRDCSSSAARECTAPEATFLPMR